MSEKAIALINDNPEVKEICLRIRERDTFLQKQIEGLQKRAKEFNEKTQEENAGEWEALEGLLKDKLPEDFSDEKYYLGLDMNSGVIKLGKKGEDDIPEFIKMMMGKKPNN